MTGCRILSRLQKDQESKSNRLHKNLIEITSFTCGSIIMAKFGKVSVAISWASLIEMHEKISKQDTLELLPFASSYLSE